MTARPFPQLTPTARSYKPGRIPETVFTSQNGSTTFVQFGGAFVNAELSLTFANISDQDAADILQHYSSVVGDDRVTFGDNKGLGGMGAKLQGKLEDGTGLLTLRFFHFRQSQVSQFKQGTTVQVFGTPRWLGGQVEMIHPEYRLGASADLVEAALTPVYPTASGLGQSTWRKLCGQALNLLSKNPPEDLLRQITDDNITLADAM